MIFSDRTATCTALLLFVSTVLGFASPASSQLVIKPGSDRVVAIRYQAGTNSQGTWTEVEASQPLLLPEEFDSTRDTLFVQQKEIDQGWGNKWEYRWDSERVKWEVTLPSVEKTKRFTTTIAIAPYALFPVGSSSTFYSHLIGASLAVNLNFGERMPLYGYGEVGYSRGPSRSDWVDTMQAFDASIGIGYHMGVGKRAGFAPELGYGVIVHILDADFDQDGTKAYDLFLDQKLRLSLAFSYELSNSYELFAAPLGVLFFENSSVALLLGLQAGIRYTI